MDLINAGKMEDIQIINDRQVKTTHAYKNTKQKLLKTKAAIWLKKKCPSNHPTSKYVNFAVGGEKIVSEVHNKP